MEVTTRRPDVVKPDAKLLQEAYELASEVYDMEPWIDFIEEQVLAIEFADGSRRFLSVMGRQGQHVAIALYPDMGTYWRVRCVEEGDEVDAFDAFMSTHQLQLVFCSASNLMKGERAAIKASGVKFPRGVNPSFVSYVPGFVPDAMGAGEMRETLRFLRAFFAFRKDHMSYNVQPLDTPADLVSTWAEGPDGSWKFGQDEFSHLLPTTLKVNEGLLSKFAQMAVNKKMFLEVGAYPIPVSKTPFGRGKMSRLVFVTDHASGYIFATHVFETPDDRETDWTPIFEFVLKTMLKLGKRPGRLATSNVQLNAVFATLFMAECGGTEVVQDRYCESAREAFMAFRQDFFGGRV